MKTLIITIGLAIIIGLGAVWLHATPQRLQTSNPAPTGLLPSSNQGVRPAKPRVVSPPILASPPLATPTIGTPSATPPTIVVSTPSTVTVTVVISPVPNLNSVNLLRVGATGTQPTILGVMHDDGKNGDLAAGDGIYTLQVSLNEALPGQIQLQVSAAFQGLLKRSTSPAVTINVWSVFSSQSSSFSIDYPPGAFVATNSASSTSIQTSPEYDATGASPEDIAPITTEGFQFTVETDPPVVGAFNITTWLTTTSPLWNPSTVQTTSVGGRTAYLIPPEDPSDYTTIIVPTTSFVYVITYNTSFFTDAANSSAQAQIGFMLSSISFH